MNEWHIPDPALRAWVDGTAPMTTAASVEQHLISCDRCRSSVAALATPTIAPDLDLAWQGIRDAVEAQPLNLVGRTLHRFGMSEPEAILLSSAPAVTGAWITGVALVALFTVFAAGTSPGRGLAAYLIVAPLLPVAGVAAAYGSEADPTYELTLSAPFSKLRLLLLRTGAVVATCVPITALAALPMTGPWWIAVVWLLPAAAFVMLTLAAATYAPPAYAAGGIAIGWIALTAPALLHREPLQLVSSSSLIAYAVIAVIGGLVFSARSQHLATDWRIG
jgi:hypothetical protein